MERELAAEGYATLNLDYPARRLALADIAETIAPQVAAFAAGVSRLHIVTHSMGGFVARVILVRHRPANLGRVVMLGPPNGGSEVADALHRLAPYRRFFGPAGAELVTLRGWAGARARPARPSGGVVASGASHYVEDHETVVRSAMTRSIADISWDELDEIARKAGASAAGETVKAGVSTFGIVDGRAVQVAPDGEIRDLGPIAEFGDGFAVPEKPTMPENDKRPARRKSVRNPMSRSVT
ncbi:esterase/lipase family protein [Methylorubrum podarium]|uniref:esterase/lipase family protein n=1 Tax=Methylorubrum podarium TaxID=200476 RepID=UPI0035A252AA